MEPRNVTLLGKKDTRADVSKDLRWGVSWILARKATTRVSVRRGREDGGTRGEEAVETAQSDLKTLRRRREVGLPTGCSGTAAVPTP